MSSYLTGPKQKGKEKKLRSQTHHGAPSAIPQSINVKQARQQQHTQRNDEYNRVRQQFFISKSLGNEINPMHYVVSSKHEIREAINETIKQYQNVLVNWQVTEDRFEPAIVDSASPSKRWLCRMNGEKIRKCEDDFVGAMARIKQCDILFFIKNALKLFIEYRSEHYHQCKWRRMLEGTFTFTLQCLRLYSQSFHSLSQVVPPPHQVVQAQTLRDVLNRN